MKCVSPIKVKGFTGVVSCGQCLPCRLTRQSMWTTRLMHEAKSHDASIFVTLTYDDEHNTGTVLKYDAQCFIKRLRSFIHPKKFRYYITGEYGEKYKRPHYHALIFGLDSSYRSAIEYCWKMGFIHIGDVTEDSIKYCSKYIQKKLSGKYAEIYELEQVHPEFCLMSKKPALGYTYAQKYLQGWIENGFIWLNGQKKPIPKYYIRNITDEQKNLLLHHSKKKEVKEFNKKFDKIGGYDTESRKRKQIVTNLLSKQKLKKTTFGG